MKRAQLYGQIFVYILTIVVVGFILVYGYRAIAGIRDRADQVMIVQFEKDAKSIVQSIAGDFGSVVKKELSVDDKTNLVCFVETFENIANRNSPQLDTESYEPTRPINPLIKESISSNSESNSFLLGDGLRGSFNICSISVEKDVLCVRPQNSKIILRVEGAGDHAKISVWA